MKNNLVDFINNLLQLNHIKGKTSKFLYWYLNKKMEETPEVCFLNYGYSPLAGERIPLEAKDEANRVYIQLYHSVAGAIDLSGLDVLEISCGRGGGAKYLKQYHKPRLMCGIDRARKAINFCQKHHAEDGLCFAYGDAQALPIADSSFDAVVNIEASHDYLDLPKFLSEVERVLRPGGHFLYADFRKQQQYKPWHDQLMHSGLALLQEEDVTRNVIKGLELNTEHNTSLVRKLAPWHLRPVFMQFAGIQGSCVYERFDTGKSFYWRYVLRKEI